MLASDILAILYRHRESEMAHRTKRVSLMATLTSTMVWVSAVDILTSRAQTKFTTKNTRLIKRKSRYSGSLCVRKWRQRNILLTPNIAKLVEEKKHNVIWDLILPVSQKLWCILRLCLENNLWKQNRSCIMQMASCYFGSTVFTSLFSVILKEEPRSWGQGSWTLCTMATETAQGLAYRFAPHRRPTTVT